MKPIYEVANVRKNSAAEKVGLQKGDIIIKINDNIAYQYSLQEINFLFKSLEDKWINIEIERESQILKFRFKLDDIL